MTEPVRILRPLIVLISLFFSSLSMGQINDPILLNSGEVVLEMNNELSKKTFEKAKKASKDASIKIIQFSEIPTEKVKQNLLSSGITLLNYLPTNAYFAQISSSANWQSIVDSKMVAVSDIKSSFKLSEDLANEKYHDWATIGQNRIVLNGKFFSSFSKSNIEASLMSVGARVELINDAQIARFSIEISKLNEAYELGSFHYFEQIDPPSVPENLVGVSDHRSNTLASAYANGLHYTGEGVTVMLQDNSRLDAHIDYTGRFFNYPSATNSGDHGEHCGGTIAGAGNIDPTTRGMAYGADVLVFGSSNDNYDDVPALYTSEELRITSKSYSNGTNAGYTTLASELDEQVRLMPELIHVFSAGNSNGSGPTAAGSQWYNLTGGHKAAKNVIAVGNVTRFDVINNSSSRGPSADGRIKPDICAVGTSVYSTIDPNNYGNKTGTSMSCPGVAGVLAQLYEAYKDLNGGNNPESALIKATVLNTADDLGNSGPDFIYGWGRINARRAFDVLNNNQYFSGDISQGANLSHTISVPAGVAQVRIMVHWSDYEAVPNATQALVNDINMTVVSPNNVTTNPWILDHTPNATLLNMPATQGVDNINNMEQVTIETPTPGVYTINLNGFSIPSGPQRYYVVYETVTDDIVLTYPVGGEGFDSAEDEVIRWDALNDAGTFDLEYSDDNGASWNTISSSINASRRYYDWNVPNIVTGEALVRVTRGASSSQSIEPFSIIRVPQNLDIVAMCPDSVTLTWDPVANATGYEVSILGNLYMDSVGTSTSNTITVAHPNVNNLWWSVKALGANNCVGRRAIAQYQGAGLINCTIDTDAAVTDETGLDGKTIFTCSEVAPLTIGATITNYSVQPISSVPLSYQLNGGTVVNETYTGTLAPGASVYYSFTNQQAIAFGSNTLEISCAYVGDQNSNNNQVILQFDYLDVVAETLPFSEDFESFPLCSTDNDCEAIECPVPNNFVNSKNLVEDDIDWRSNSGDTPSNNTGPDFDFNPGNTSGRYVYLEASGAPVCSNKEGALITPCIDLGPEGHLSFAYHMSGSDMGELHVDILVNGTWINDIMPVISGDQGSAWLEQTVDLGPYAFNIVSLRFRGITGSDFNSDIAIDDINIDDALNVDNLSSNQFAIYPNPSNGTFFYKITNTENAKIEVTDAQGKIVFFEDVSQNQGEIDLSNVSKGVYFVQFTTNETSTNKRVVIQ